MAGSANRALAITVRRLTSSLQGSRRHGHRFSLLKTACPTIFRVSLVGPDPPPINQKGYYTYE
jgi:hypothetical protein